MRVFESRRGHDRKIGPDQRKCAGQGLSRSPGSDRGYPPFASILEENWEEIGRRSQIHSANGGSSCRTTDPQIAVAEHRDATGELVEDDRLEQLLDGTSDSRRGLVIDAQDENPGM